MNLTIEALARRKSYGELTEAERALVLAEMPAEMYEQLRAILQAAPVLDAGPGPSEALEQRLMARMSAVPARRPWYGRRIPLWQAAAAMALVLAVMSVLRSPETRIVEVPVVQRSTDTVFVEKIIWRERLVVREKRQQPAPQSPPVASWERPAPSDVLPDSQNRETINPSETGVGSSLENTPDLLNFFVAPSPPNSR